jgi:hypothetical protein
MKATIPLLLLTMLATTAHGAETKPALDPSEAKALEKALEGGEPVSCVDIRNGTNLRALGDHTLVYRVSRTLIYRNDLIGTCYGLRMGDALVMNINGSQYCRGDIAKAVDLHSGNLSGTCALGDFVPYRAAAADKSGKAGSGGR